MGSSSAANNSMVYLPSRVRSPGESVCHHLPFVAGGILPPPAISRGSQSASACHSSRESVCHRLQFAGKGRPVYLIAAGMVGLWTQLLPVW